MTIESPSVSARLALIVVAAYRIVLSPLVGGTCRFLPSCSVYAEEAILAHGALRGCWLALTRLSRCHPFGGSGYDPVPLRVSGVSTHQDHDVNGE